MFSRGRMELRPTPRASCQNQVRTLNFGTLRTKAVDAVRRQAYNECAFSHAEKANAPRLLDPEAFARPVAAGQAGTERPDLTPSPFRIPNAALACAPVRHRAKANRLPLAHRGRWPDVDRGGERTRGPWRSQVWWAIVARNGGAHDKATHGGGTRIPST